MNSCFKILEPDDKLHYRLLIVNVTNEVFHGEIADLQGYLSDKLNHVLTGCNVMLYHSDLSRYTSIKFQIIV